jgi:hypothetical protein
MMLPLGVTTAAALLRGSFRAAPGNHVRGAARKLAPTNNGVSPIRHRERNSSFVFIVVSFGFFAAGLDTPQLLLVR